MCNSVVLKNGGALKSVPNQSRSHDKCNKAVDNYAHALEFVPDLYKTQ